MQEEAIMLALRNYFGHRKWCQANRFPHADEDVVCNCGWTILEIAFRRWLVNDKPQQDPTH